MKRWNKEVCGLRGIWEKYFLSAQMKYNKETFFINPANEPIVKRIFEELCEHEESEQLNELAQA